MKKKMLATVLVATMMLSITACGGKEDAQPSSTSTTEQQVQEQTQEDGEAGKEELGPLFKTITFTQSGEGVDVYMNFPMNYSYFL